MPQVTDIKPQKRQNRFNIYIDGKFSFGLDAEQLVKSRLKIGELISQEKIEELIRNSEFQKIYDRSLKFLSYRPRSEKELSDWFMRKEVGEETKTLVLSKLKQQGFINDQEFARWWVEQRMSFHPTGTRLLKLELVKKGIPRGIIQEQLEQIIDDPDAVKVQAKKLIEKKMKIWQDLPEQELRQKLYGVLVRKGFPWDVVKLVVESELKK